MENKKQPATVEEIGKNVSTKGTKMRSPAYPGINLEMAIKRAGELFAQDRMNTLPVMIAAKRWGYKEKSSSVLITVAALKAFGLIKDSGSGKDRKIQLTEEARRILLDQRPESLEREAAIKEAAMKPKIHSKLWEKWGAEIPPDDNFSHYLIFDEEFNEKSVGDFIKEYKDTIRYAKLGESDTISEGENDKEKIKVGDYVQWESQGVLQFKEPVPVSGFSDDGAYAFVEGTNTGLPLEELIKMETLGGQEVRHGSREGVTITPNPAVGRFSTRGPIVQMGMNSDTFTLDEGQVVLQWPAKMSPESYEDFKAWLDLIARKAKRTVDKGDARQDED